MNPFYKLNQTLANIGKEQDNIAEQVAKAEVKSPVRKSLEESLRSDMKALMEDGTGGVNFSGSGSLEEKAGKKNWIAGATKNKGGLHKSLGVPADKPIPAGKLAKATHSSNPKIKKQANLAKTLKGLHEAEPVTLESVCPSCHKAPCCCDESIGHDIADKKEKMRIAKGGKAGPLKNVGRGIKAFLKNEPEPMDEVAQSTGHPEDFDFPANGRYGYKMGGGGTPYGTAGWRSEGLNIYDKVSRKIVSIPDFTYFDGEPDQEELKYWFYNPEGEALDEDIEMMEYLKSKSQAKPYNSTGHADAYAGLEFEGNAFTGKLAHTPKGGEFDLDGKEYTDTSSLEETVSRKHFQQVADLLKNIPDEAKRKELAMHHASIFAKQNPRFDMRRFGQAAGVDLEECAMWEDLKGGQKKLDRNHNGKLDANDFAMLRKGNMVDEDDYEDEFKVGQTRTTHKGGTLTKTPGGVRHTAGPKNYGGFEPETDIDADEKPAKKSVVTRGRGRPATGRAAARLTKGAYKNKRQDEGEEELDEKAEQGKRKFFDKLAPAAKKVAKVVSKVTAGKKDDKAEKAGKKVTKDIEYDEKKKDDIHGKKRGSEDAKAEKAGKKVAKDIEYDEKKDKKKEKKVEETTTSGSVATSGATHPAASAMGVGQGIYDSINREVEKLIAETVDVQMARHDVDGAEQEGAVIIRATGEEADIVKDLLKNAGLLNYDNTLAAQHDHEEPCGSCGGVPCQCDDQADAEVIGLPGEMEIEIDEADAPVTMNEPDWPTNQEYSDDALQYSGGLNGPKSTGQSTIPVLASQEERQVSESDSFLNLYKAFSKIK